MDPAPRMCTAGQYAEDVLSYEPDFAGQPPLHPDLVDPQDALGAPNWTNANGHPGLGAVALGEGGRIQLGFGGCLLTTDGEPAHDLRVYEIGPAAEAAAIFLRAHEQSVPYLDPDRRLDDDGLYYYLGDLGGGPVGLDVDGLSINGQPVYFDAIMVEDDPSRRIGTEQDRGADIDAVELLTSVHPDDI